MNRSNDHANGRHGRPGPNEAAVVFELGPESQPERWEALVAGILERARPILEARRQHTLGEMLSRWRRPVVLGSAGLAAAAAAVILLLPGRDTAPGEVSFAEVMMPWPVAAWMDGSYAPTADELFQAVEEYLP